MKKIRVTITMTEEEAEWLEQICFIEDELPWQKFINRVGKTVRRARHAFQQSVQSDGGRAMSLKESVEKLNALAHRVAENARRR